jgi:hypothetical protein
MRIGLLPGAAHNPARQVPLAPLLQLSGLFLLALYHALLQELGIKLRLLHQGEQCREALVLGLVAVAIDLECIVEPCAISVGRTADDTKDTRIGKLYTGRYFITHSLSAQMFLMAWQRISETFLKEGGESR